MNNYFSKQRECQCFSFSFRKGLKESLLEGGRGVSSPTEQGLKALNLLCHGKPGLERDTRMTVTADACSSDTHVICLLPFSTEAIFKGQGRRKQDIYIYKVERPV